MQQEPSEFARLLELAAEVSPRRILEIGVFGGGTLAAFADRFPEARVVGIDPSPACDFELGRVAVGRSQDPSTRGLALSFLGGRPDVVHVDGDHSYAGTWSDVLWSCVELEADLVAVHDVACRTNPQLETWRVWEDLTRPALFELAGDAESVFEHGADALGYSWSEILHVGDWAGYGVLRRRRV